MDQSEVIFNEADAEKASNSYVMSLIALVAGLPLPIINLVATLIFWSANRKSSHFVKWHCTQALLSQSSLLIINTTGVVWTIMILLHRKEISDSYVAFVITSFAFNVLEFISTISAAVRTRKGKHAEWFFFGPLTNLIIR